MVIDTSAVFAAITGEPDSGVYRNAIISVPIRPISAVTVLETQIVLVSRSGSNSIPTLHELVERAGNVGVPFDEPMAEAAFDAFKRYGKGQGHKAQLNTVDCAACALAKTHDLPLVFKGNDFASTDIPPALLRGCLEPGRTAERAPAARRLTPQPSPRN
jgi:ribonuclease VapC